MHLFADDRTPTKPHRPVLPTAEIRSNRQGEGENLALSRYGIGREDDPAELANRLVVALHDFLIARAERQRCEVRHE